MSSKAAGMTEEATKEMADEMTVDFGFRPDRTQRDGTHAIDDPILHNGRVTTLRELGAEGRLGGELAPSCSIPPYKPDARPAYMATLRGTRQGWEVSHDTFLCLFIPVYNNRARDRNALANYLSQQLEGALV